jgi:hypothetical protein
MPVCGSVWLAFAAGLLLGTVAAVWLLALCQIAGEADERTERMMATLGKEAR